MGDRKNRRDVRENEIERKVEPEVRPESTNRNAGPRLRAGAGSLLEV